MSRKPQIAQLVAALEGRWEGLGEGGYPTIDPFTYRETTRITTRDDHPAIHYEQRTWRQTPDGEIVSHWETGLIRISSDGSVTVHNAQAGRAESLFGTWRRDSAGWTMELSSHSFAGDERMIEAARTFEIADDTMAYEMSMHTTSTSQLLFHLSAELSRAR